MAPPNFVDIEKRTEVEIEINNLLVVPPPAFWTFHRFCRPLPGVIYDSLFTLQDLDMTFFMPYFEIALDNTAICTLYVSVSNKIIKSI